MRNPESTKKRSTPAQPARVAPSRARSTAAPLAVDVGEVEDEDEQDRHASKAVEGGDVAARRG